MPSSSIKKDRFPQIAEDLSLRATRIDPLHDLVLIEANAQETMIGSLYVPIEAIETYPTSGWIYAIGPDAVENLRIGDFVLVEEEGLALSHTYYDVFEILLRHDNGELESIWAEIEVEPVVREQVTKYRRGGEDTFLKTIDKKNGGSIGFNCSNVMSWQFGEIANPSYNLTYLPTVMFIALNEDEIPALFYLLSERKILTTVEYSVDPRASDGPLQPDRGRA